MQIIKRTVCLGLGLIFCFIFQSNNYVYADGEVLPVIAQETEYSEITAKSAIVMEATTGQVLYEKNSQEQCPVSHLVKLMTLLKVQQAIKSGKFNLDTMHTTSSHANLMGDPQIWLNVGEKISTDDLIKSITIGNANDGCAVLAEAILSSEEAFVTDMNAQAEKMGMNNTYFINCTGIETEGQYSCANDIALVAKELLKYEDLEQYFMTWMLTIRGGQTELVSTNKLIRTYNGITGMKAAASSKAGNCLVATAKRGNLNLICVVLSSLSPDSRFDEAKDLLNVSFAQYQMFSPEIEPENLEPIKVKHGEQAEVDVERIGSQGLVIKRGISKDVEVKVIREDEIEAPVLKGSAIGKIQYFLNGKLVLEDSLNTKSEVNKVSITFTFKKLFEKLLNL